MKQKQKLTSTILSSISCCSLGLLFVLMDTVSYGRNLIQGDDNLSMFVFLLSTMMSQLAYNMFTSINSGIVASAIVENYVIIKQIFEKCKMNAENESVIPTMLVCVFLGTLLFSFFSFMLMRYNLSRYLKFMPKSAITGCLGAIGLAQFEIALCELGFTDFSLQKIDKPFLILFGLTFLVAFVAFVLSERFSDVSFMIPLYSLLAVLFYYAITIYGLQYTLDKLRDLKHLSQKNSVCLTFKVLIDNLPLDKVSIKGIFTNAFNIFSLAMFSMIHLPINLPVFCLSTGTTADFNRELKVQSFGNLITSFCFSPVYFVCSNSIFFRKAGGTRRIHGIILAPLILVLFKYGMTIKSYIPVIFLAMFPFFIGLSICYSTLLELKKATTFDCFVASAVIVACQYYSMVVGLTVGIFLNMVWFVRQYSKSVRNKQFITNTEDIDANLVVVDYILYFGTVGRFVDSCLVEDERPVVFDFINCGGCDWLGIDIFKDTVNTMKESNKVVVVGWPDNFDFGAFEKTVGVLCYESYESLVNDS